MVLIRLTLREAQKLAAYVERSRYHPMHVNEDDAGLHLALRGQIRGAIQTFEKKQREG